MKRVSTQSLAGRIGVFVVCGVAAVGVTGAAARARAQAPASQASTSLELVEVGDAKGQIYSFQPDSGTTDIYLRGSGREAAALMKARIRGRQGFVEIEINRGDIQSMRPASVFGPDFLTYVLWAVSPEGAATNLGEIVFASGRPEGLKVTTGLQAFWLMVTAEPDFGVANPSKVMVLYSTSPGPSESLERALGVPGALFYYTYYTNYAPGSAAEASGSPELRQARKALALAGAAAKAAAGVQNGEAALKQAQAYVAEAEVAFKAGDNRRLVIAARTAVQIAEGARALFTGAVGGVNLARLEKEIADAQALVAEANARTGEQADKVGQAEAAVKAEQVRTAEAERRIATLQRQFNDLEQAFTNSIGQSQAANEKLRADRDKICGELQSQFAAIGQLAQRGNEMALTLSSDILFDSGSYKLRAEARESLAKLAMLRLILFPNARIRFEGHTDRVGRDDFNLWLSEQRAIAVYEYFLQEELSHQDDPATLDARKQTMEVVQQLLGEHFPTSQREIDVRHARLSRLGDAVVGRGETEPVEDTERPSEANRRVVLIFPPAQTGQITSLCAAATAQ